MKSYVFILVITVTVLVGCSTHYSRVRNGISEYDSHCSPLGYNCSVEINDAQYPKAIADIGPMPGGMEQTLAVQRVMVNETARNNAVLYPYGAYGNIGGVPINSNYALQPRSVNLLIHDQYGNVQLVPGGYRTAPNAATTWP